MDRSSMRQRELLEHVDGFIKEHGYGPSYREIMTALGYKSVSTVATHIDGLLAKGYLRKATRSARSLEVVTLQEPRAVSATKHRNVTEYETWLVSKIQAGIDAEKISSEDIDVLTKVFEKLELPVPKQVKEGV